MADDKIATVPKDTSLTAAPDYFAKNDRRGFEDTHQSDLQIPRLALAQPGKPQVTDGHPKRIEGLNGGDLYNSVTNQIYGKEVFVQLLRKMPLRAMEFIPVKDGGGVADPNVPLHDDRCKWHGDEKPVATVFRDFIAVLLPQREIIALSFKSSGIKAAKALWGLAAMRNKPVFAGRYRITTALEIKPELHTIYKVENAGWVTAEDAKLGEEMFEAVQVISAEKIDHSSHDDDIDDSMAANPEGAASEM